MKVACANVGAATQVSGVLSRHAISQHVSWQRSTAGKLTALIVVNAAFDPAAEAAMRRDIEIIAGATIGGVA